MKVVLVEDNPLLWKSVVRYLKQNNITAEHIKNWEEAEYFWKIHNKEIDLVILDLMLPWKSGIEVCKSIRKQGIHTPVIMLTAKWTLADKWEGFASGVDDYLVKPFELEELLMRIQALMKRPLKREKNIIQLWENIRVDLDAMSVEKSWEYISLTAKEYAILSYLIAHKNTPLSQQKIFDNVFDFWKDNWSNTIEVHIKNLRKKLFWKHGKEIIQTVRGLGYKIEI